jgi:hypothetical protein
MIAEHGVDRNAVGEDRLEDVDHAPHLVVDAAVRIVDEVAGHEHERRLDRHHLAHEPARGVGVRPPHPHLQVGEDRYLLAFPPGGKVGDRRHLVVARDESRLDGGTVHADRGEKLEESPPHCSPGKS